MLCLILTLEDGLRAYFTAYGDIDQCTIMRDPTGRSRGFAFLTFKDPASVTRVLEKDHQLDGKMVSAAASPGRPQLYSLPRSTPSAPSRAPSTSAPPRSLSAASLRP
jgi:RNA recognition motif-containing protein